MSQPIVKSSPGNKDATAQYNKYTQAYTPAQYRMLRKEEQMDPSKGKNGHTLATDSLTFRPNPETIVLSPRQLNSENSKEIRECPPC